MGDVLQDEILSVALKKYVGITEFLGLALTYITTNGSMLIRTYLLES